ncbi:ATP-binding protein [Spirillospora sp. NPDC048819]|uniref:ATP-binding protein n=1 Tax=Spirillospora sp. NPDC048819 TaxID=3155268 RepID=UPI0033F2FE47
MDGGAGAVAKAPDVTFRATPKAPGRVRTLVRLRLAGWGLSGISDDVMLIASELVTNAALYASEREIRVRLTRETGAVLLAVWDSSDARPVRKRELGATTGDATPDAEALDPGHDAETGGRGLPIVAAMSEKCWVEPTEPRGKWVCARYSIAEAAAVPSARMLTLR